jgi:hypothetical protein
MCTMVDNYTLTIRIERFGLAFERNPPASLCHLVRLTLSDLWPASVAEALVDPQRGPGDENQDMGSWYRPGDTTAENSSSRSPVQSFFVDCQKIGNFREAHSISLHSSLSSLELLEEA